MAVTINASTTAGLVQTADTTGNLSLQSNGTTIAALTSTGLAVTGAGSFSTTLGVTGQASFSKNSTYQALFTGYSPAGGASATNGAIEIGLAGNGPRIQFDNAGNTVTYFDSQYDSASSSTKFRTRTTGTPIDVITYTGAGVVTIPGTLLVKDGTAGAVAISSPTALTDTGIYFPAARQVAIATAGVQRFLVDINGAVTIPGTLGVTGSVGINTTLAAWSGRSVLQVANGGVNYGPTAANGGSTGFFNNGYWNGSADKAIITGYSQIVACNDNNSGRVIILTTSGTSSADATISYTAGPYVSAGGTSWTSSSDERLKNITGEIKNGLSKVMLLRSAEFTWKDDINNKPCVGLIAQDVQVVLPEAVNTTTKYNSNDKTEYLGISYNETIPLLVAAIKEQQALIAQLTAKVTALEAK